MYAFNTVFITHVEIIEYLKNFTPTLYRSMVFLFIKLLNYQV